MHLSYNCAHLESSEKKLSLISTFYFFDNELGYECSIHKKWEWKIDSSANYKL